MISSVGVTADVARGLMSRLEKEGLIKAASKGKRLGKLINKDMVEEAIKKYFDNKSTNGDTVPLDPVSVTLCVHVLCNVSCSGDSG